MIAEPHDPARAGPPVPTSPDGLARFSLAEIETLSAKAGRGAGLSWGLAEEAGAAARWLAAQGLPGPELLLRHLEAYDRRPWVEVAPIIDGGPWRTADGGALCPIAAGAALSDRAGLPDGPGACTVTLDAVASPGLILPFAAFAAQATGCLLRVRWQDFEAIVTATSVALAGDEAAMSAAVAHHVAIERAHGGSQSRPAATGRTVALDIWRRLDALALRTTVPASDQSRADAGAGTSDND